MAYYGASHPCCNIVDCKEEFHNNWLVDIEIQPLNGEVLTFVRAESLMQSAWLQRLKDEAYVSSKILHVKYEMYFCFMFEFKNLI
jgi:hypothetical protein